MSEHHFITGVAGFIGSHLADALLDQGHSVSGIDDLSLGRMENLNGATRSEKFRVLRGNVCEGSETAGALQESINSFGPIAVVWHLAANSDIAAGVADASIDFDRTLRTTFSVIEGCKKSGIGRIAFASTSAIYGELKEVLHEGSAPLLPISNYGATKLGGEALLSAAVEGGLERIWIFRFPNVVGPRATHGALYDFTMRLKGSPDSLRVLGNGTQQKPYLHVKELVEAMQFIVEKAKEKRNVFLIGPEDEGSSVRFLAEETLARMAPGTPIEYTGGDRGWVGDVPRFHYSTRKLAELGWGPRMGSDQAVRKAIEDLAVEHGF